MIRRRPRTRVRRRDLEPGPPLPPEVEERIWAEVQRRIAMGEAGRPKLEPLPDRRPLVLSFSFAFVICALLVAGLLATQRSGQDQEVATGDTIEDSNQITLNDLAREARTRPARHLAAGDILSLTIARELTETQSPTEVTGQRVTTEMAGDGHGQEVTWTDGQDDPEERSYGPGRLQVGGFTPDEIAELPGDPEALLARLQGAGGEGPLSPRVPLQLLATPLVPASTRAALFHVLDDLGAEVGGLTTDARGRTGVAVVATFPGEQVEAVIDPTTTLLLTLRRDNPELDKDDPALEIYEAVTIVPDG